jgi:hypothetical protein
MDSETLWLAVGAATGIAALGVSWKSYTSGRVARLAPVFGPAGTIGMTKGRDDGEIVPILRNEGKHAAYDVSLTLEHADKTTVAAKEIVSIAPGEERPIAIPITQDDFIRARNRPSTVQFSFRDGAGRHKGSFRVRLIGYDGPNWQVLLGD